MLPSEVMQNENFFRRPHFLHSTFSTNIHHNNQSLSFKMGCDIESLPYCSHKCLLGLANKGALDPTCPNATHHGPEHLDLPNLLSELCDVRDFLHSEAAVFLGLSGSVGFCCKVNVRGYVMVAKCTRQHNEHHLEYEASVYARVLRQFQGTFVPVCLGLVKSYPNATPDHKRSMLLLSWGGDSLASVSVTRKQLVQVERIYLHFREIRFLHHGGKLRNILCHPETKKIMVIDFEKSESRRSSVSLNGVRRTNTVEFDTGGSLDFYDEFLQVMMSVRDRCTH